jgi:nucleotide-binding universal stress UspA family protein
MYTTIVVALDGSEPSIRGGEIALAVARSCGARLLAAHIYGARLHGQRFRDMEPGLPDTYQQPEAMQRLRGSHDSLIEEGFQTLSVGFVEHFLAAAAEAGVEATPHVAEGRNYVGLLDLARREAADLLVLGATGLGALEDGLLGTTAARVLRAAPCDVLVARTELEGGGLLAGVDGSEAALAAVDRAAGWARALDRPLCLGAAYDPEFHKAVFRTLARALPPERHATVGLAEQEDLHDRIINDGLARLYGEFLTAAEARCPADLPSLETTLLQGKAYRALSDEAARTAAGLVVVGRFGHHREPAADIGATAEALARTSTTNVLVVAPAPSQGAAP